MESSQVSHLSSSQIQGLKHALRIYYLATLSTIFFFPGLRWLQPWQVYYLSKLY